MTFVRSIGRWTMTALVINCIIGTGIFGLPGELTRLLVRQNGGIEVEFRFENWRMDPAVSDTMFRFTPPEGVAIVNGELPEADAAVR